VAIQPPHSKKQVFWLSSQQENTCYSYGYHYSRSISN
jgi:hypothetical protein